MGPVIEAFEHLPSPAASEGDDDVFVVGDGGESSPPEETPVEAAAQPAPDPRPPSPVEAVPTPENDCVLAYLRGLADAEDMAEDFRLLIMEIRDDAIDGVSQTVERAYSLVKALLGEPAVSRGSQPTAGRREGHATNNRQPLRRPGLYREAQRLWSKDRTRLADAVIDGTLGHAIDVGPDIREVEEAYAEIYGGEPRPDDAGISDYRNHDVQIYAPITVEEVRAVVHQRQSSSKGPDGYGIDHFRSVPPTLLAVLFNTIIYCASMPVEWRTNRTTLIPKAGGDPATVDGWRPITISSIGCRLLGKMLAGRFKELPLHHSQRGFRNTDGTLANTLLLQTIIKSHRQLIRPHSITTLDLRKAFDTVSHASLRRSLDRFKIPTKVKALIMSGYTECTTTITASGQTTRPIPIRRGVKQGDPLSPYLFNMVVDELLCLLTNQGGGLGLGGTRIPTIAYADDLVLLAESRADMQIMVRTTQKFLDRRGMKINPIKSTSFTVNLLPSVKKLYVSTEARIIVENDFIRAIGVADQFGYLGFGYSFCGVKSTTLEGLPAELERIRKAPLKPHQKLYVIKKHLLPRYIYILQNPDITLKTLSSADRLVRLTVKRILHLPQSTPNAALYAPLRQGGLGVFSFRCRIPGILLDRISNIRKSPDPDTLAAIRTPYIAHLEEKLHNWCATTGVNSRATASFWCGRLESSTSGGGLWHVGGHSSCSAWIESPPQYWTGRDYVRAILLRYNLLPTAGGLHNRAGDVRCRAGCERRETVCHVLQKCPATHYERMARHNRIARLLARRARERGFEVVEEPRIRDAAGLLYKPDLLCKKDGVVGIVEVGIHWEGPDPLTESYRGKVARYAHPAFTDAVAAKYPGVDVRVMGFVLGARGGWCRLNADAVQLLSLSKKHTTSAICDTLKGGWIAHAAHGRVVWAPP